MLQINFLRDNKQEVIEKLNFNNLIVINIFKLGANKVIDSNREKIFKTFLKQVIKTFKFF